MFLFFSGKEENGMIVTKSDFNPADNKEKGVQGETVIIAVIIGGVVVAIIIFIGCYYMWKCRLYTYFSLPFYMVLFALYVSMV